MFYHSTRHQLKLLAAVGLVSFLIVLYNNRQILSRDQKKPSRITTVCATQPSRYLNCPVESLQLCSPDNHNTVQKSIDAQLRSCRFVSELFTSSADDNFEVRCLTFDDLSTMSDVQLARLRVPEAYMIYPMDVDLNDVLMAYSCGLALNVKPINNLNISIVYSSKSVCASGTANSYWTMIIVKSALTNYARRLQLRKIISREAVEAKVRVGVLFSLGLPVNGQIPPDLLDEIAQFDDILLASYSDTYYNLTLKTISNLRFVHRHCLHASSTFVFLDDDHGISLKQLRRFFSNLPLSEVRRSIFGHINAGSPVMRTNESKWMTERKAFPFPKYPQYAAGPCYIIGADLISKFSIAAAFTQLFPVEDVFVGIIAAKLGLRIRPLPKMHIHRSRIPRRPLPLVAELKFFARKPIT
ncbi:hypothetical protein AAHC03_019019 [Spirometra sp. Aus1]